MIKEFIKPETVSVQGKVNLNFYRLIWHVIWTFCLSVSSVQVAIAQFSDDARTEFQLSSHGNKEALLEAIQRIRYKGGNTKTGENSSMDSYSVLVGSIHVVIVCLVWQQRYIQISVYTTV